METTGLALNINVADVFNYISQLFTAYWPLLAFGLGVLAFPMIVGAAKSIISSRRR
ncbi:hypothetical protein JOD02_001854 [Caldicoprobacter guelmensis]|uniref:hypothetical protein n=1 Tax=Caldicoprobacter guelmensis TaxID=1170224 RepID=UPI00195E90D0|nr:hypothetical protein [Caldicoprobacter guelmensis]MBM7582985.1 hypothetical protein [Caldicoprobacter guelmensis]